MKDIDSLKLVSAIVKILDDKKAQNIEVIKVNDISTMTDYFVICSGGSTTQIKALSDAVEVGIKEQFDLNVSHREGYTSASWVLLDYINVILNVFQGDARDFYKLERLWADGEHIDISNFIGEGE